MNHTFKFNSLVWFESKKATHHTRTYVCALVAVYSAELHTCIYQLYLCVFLVSVSVSVPTSLSVLGSCCYTCICICLYNCTYCNNFVCICTYNFASHTIEIIVYLYDYLYSVFPLSIGASCPEGLCRCPLDQVSVSRSAIHPSYSTNLLTQSRGVVCQKLCSLANATSY